MHEKYDKHDMAHVEIRNVVFICGADTPKPRAKPNISFPSVPTVLYWYSMNVN